MVLKYSFCTLFFCSVVIAATAQTEFDSLNDSLNGFSDDCSSHSSFRHAGCTKNVYTQKRTCGKRFTTRIDLPYVHNSLNTATHQKKSGLGKTTTCEMVADIATIK